MGEDEGNKDGFGGLFLQFTKKDGEEGESSEQAGKLGPMLEGLDMILELLGGAGMIPGGDMVATELVKKGYDQIAEKYRPLLKFLPVILSLPEEDLAEVVAAIYKVVNDLAENEKIQVESDRNKKIKAGKRWRTYKAYTEAGFTPTQAFDLLVLDSSRSTTGSSVTNLIASEAGRIAPAVKKVATTKAKTSGK